MKKIEKKKKLTKGGLAIVLAAAFVVTLATALVLYFTVFTKEKEPEKKEPPTALEGEAVVNGNLMAYPLMQESQIQTIEIISDKGAFGMSRPDGKGNFIFEYADENGEIKKFMPNIADIDDDFKYSDIYSIEMGDGFGGVTKLKYLCMALMYPYVEERIELIPEEEAAQLDAYGLAEGEYETVVFSYVDENGEKKSHRIDIGDKTTLETGYYIRVDGRNYVYASYQNQLDYALAGFFSFIKPIVIAPGIKEDTVISAYLTTNYYQWQNTVHKNLGDITANDSRVVVLADTIVPVDKSFKEIIDGGYIKDGERDIEFDLSKYKNKPEYQRLVKALSAKPVGFYSDNEIVFTLEGVGAVIEFGLFERLEYEYSVVAVEAILTDDGEISASGAAVGENNLVKLAYRLKIGGVEASSNILHAVVDLSDAALPESFTGAIRASSVGELASPVILNVNYTKDNANKQSIKYVITELVGVFDEKGAEMAKVTDTCELVYRYSLMINGVLSEEDELVKIAYSDKSEFAAKIRTALKGKSPSRDSISVVADEYVEYCEYFNDFITYKVSQIKYFVTKNLVSAFRFQNKSDRDPFYGESIYENAMTNKYSMYGLNNSVCQKVVNILTGISEDANSTPTGLVGSEIVAVGLTPALMEQYGLYAYTIYFELPRGIYTLENPDPNTVDDYAWYEILGFTLHISDELEDESGIKFRYVASDLYNTVVKIDAENFVFLKYDFVNFFARREMMLTDVAYMQEATFELCFENLKGLYQMNLIHEDVYWGTDGKRYEYEEDVPDGVGVESTFDEITVVVKPTGECTPNKLVDYVNQNTSTGFVSLSQLYNKLTGDGKYQIFSAYDPLGTSNFKKFLENIYLTGYSGIIPPSEQEEIRQNSEMLFRMSYKIESSAHRYVYEFYRYSEGKVMVRLYQADYDKETNSFSKVAGDVSDFYISNFAFRKIVNNFVNLMNVQMIDKEAGYQE
jgi:hypothetical protein